MLYLRKSQIVSILLILLIIFSGCTKKWSYLMESDSEYTARIGEELAHAIETRDSEKIKSMLSIEALSNTTEEDLNTGLQYLFDTYKGTFVKIFQPISSSSALLGKPYNYKIMYSHCTLITTKGEFTLYFPLYKKFDINKDVIGIYSIRLNSADQTIVYDRDYSGVYHPEWEERPEFFSIHDLMTKKYIDPYLQEYEKQKQTSEEETEVD